MGSNEGGTERGGRQGRKEGEGRIEVGVVSVGKQGRYVYSRKNFPPRSMKPKIPEEL